MRCRNSIDVGTEEKDVNNDVHDLYTNERPYMPIGFQRALTLSKMLSVQLSAMLLVRSCCLRRVLNDG